MSFWTALASFWRGFAHPPTPPLLPAGTPIESPLSWEHFDGGLDTIPVGKKGLVEVYGDIKPTYSTSGDVIVDRAWERANMMTARGLPGYDKPLYVHRKIEGHFREALRRALVAAPEYKIKSIGCFAPRHMRHDKNRPLSYHSWGIAVDINSNDNQAYYLKTGEKLEPFSAEWKMRWPKGMPKAFVEAFESVGFEWGGRWKTFSDGMHMQLVKTK